MRLKDQRESTNFRDDTYATALQQAFFKHLSRYVMKNGHMPIASEGVDYFPSSDRLSPERYDDRPMFHPDGRGPLSDEDLLNRLFKAIR